MAVLAFLAFQHYAYSQVVDIVSDLDLPTDLAFDGNILYFSDQGSGQIARFDTGTPSAEPEIVISNIGKPTSITLYGGYLYYSDYQSSQLMRIALDDPNPVAEIVAEFTTPVSFMNVKGHELYFTRGDVSKILKMDLEIGASSITDIWTGTNQHITGLAFHNETLYFGSYFTGSIYRMDISNPNTVPVVAYSGFNGVNGITVTGDELFGCASETNRIVKVNLLQFGSPAVEVVSGLSRPIAVAFHENETYFTQIWGGKVSKLGGFLSAGQPVISSIALFPNPATDRLQIAGIASSQHCQVYNAVGQTILSGNISEADALSVTSLPVGTYSIRLEDGRASNFVKK